MWFVSDMDVIVIQHINCLYNLVVFWYIYVQRPVKISIDVQLFCFLQNGCCKGTHSTCTLSKCACKVIGLSPFVSDSALEEISGQQGHFSCMPSFPWWCISWEFSVTDYQMKKIISVWVNHKDVRIVKIINRIYLELLEIICEWCRFFVGLG